MRSLINFFLLGLALLIVLGVYVFRTQLFSNLTEFQNRADGLPNREATYAAATAPC